MCLVAYSLMTHVIILKLRAVISGQAYDTTVKLPLGTPTFQIEVLGFISNTTTLVQCPAHLNLW